MKTIVLNKNSWHYKVVSQLYPHTADGQHTICSYARRFILAVILAVVVIGIGGVFGVAVIVMVANTLAWLLSGMLHGFVTADASAAIGIVFVLSTIAVAIVYGGYSGVSHVYSKINVGGALKQKLSTFVCVEVEFKDEKS